MILKIRRPEVGQEVLLYGHLLREGRDKSFRGYYLGGLSLKTPREEKLETPEGFVFARMIGDEVEMYCARSEFLNMRWSCHGPGDPAWQTGLHVEKVEVKLSDLEKGYLINRMRVYGKLNSGGITQNAA